MSDEERLDWQNKFINQMLMSIKDDFIRQKYFKFIMDNQIEIVSDIFERMETDRKLKDEMMRLARNSQFDLEEFLKQKKIIQKQALEQAEKKRIEKRQRELRSLHQQNDDDELQITTHLQQSVEQSVDKHESDTEKK